MTELREKLFAVSDAGYASFLAKLVPTVKPDGIIGVRMPLLRKFAAEYKKSGECERFLRSLPHEYYEENVLHAVILSGVTDFDALIEYLDGFLPHIDNWAVCDSLKPRAFAKNRERLLPLVKEWISSDGEYTCRFGLEMLMTYFLDGDFKEEYLKLAVVDREEYYVKMMAAWFFATALAKQWDSTLPYIADGCLPVWIHNKTIQKAAESYRITDEKKKLLRGLRRKP